MKRELRKDECEAIIGIPPVVSVAVHGVELASAVVAIRTEKVRIAIRIVQTVIQITFTS